MSKFFEAVKEGLEDIIAYKKGKIELRSYAAEIPERAVKLKSKKRDKYSFAKQKIESLDQ